MRLSVCLPATRAATVVHAIRSIQRQSQREWELIVVGLRSNVTLRHTVERFCETDSRIRFVEVAAAGLSHARNAGIEAAMGECVAMIDDDCEADPEWLAVLEDCFQDPPGVGAVGGALVSPSVKGLFTWCPGYVPAEAFYDPVATPRRPPPGCDWYGANFALRRSVIDQVGPFDEYLGVGSIFGAAEETDYKLRMERLGVLMRTTPRAVVHHTYGTRRGIRPLLHSQRSYARGNAALAAKLTLMGDDRGLRWFNKNRRLAFRGWFRHPHRLPLYLRRLWDYTAAYNECLQRYAVDQRGLLYLRAAPAGRFEPAATRS